MRSFFTSIGGITALTGASVVLVESTVMDCETPSCGGGVFAYEHANVTLQRARIERCHARWGGGMRSSLSHVVLWSRPACGL
tara:strand:+ start:174 stop:419 length:246 start_codon:yes stop_codon:yes gene_type:complete